VLHGIEDQEGLSSHSRLLLRVCLGHAQHFVGIVLQHFYERCIFEQLVSQKNAVSDMYSCFVQYVMDNAIASDIHSRLYDLRKHKDEFCKIRRHLRQSHRRAKFHVHLVSYQPYTPGYTSPSLRKRIVVNPYDSDKFPSDKFHVMYSANSFVLKPPSHQQLEIHLFVTDECPFDSEKLETIMRLQLEFGSSDYFDENWLVLVVVYNLHTVPALNEWLLRARHYLLENVRKRSYVARSSDKEDNVLTGVRRSRMVGLGDVANQSGGVGPYLNIHNRRQIETSVKYEILQNTDFILDGLVAVRPFSMGLLIWG